jgi:translation initiation factor IF-3
VEVKEIKLRPKTDDHDLETKVRAARRFIEAGNKVKFTVRFRGREIAHPQRAQMQLEYLQEKADDIAIVEQRPTMEARAMSLIMIPKPQVLQRLASLKAKERAEQKKAGRADGASSPSAAEHPPIDDDDDDDDDDHDDEDDGDEAEAN